MPQTSTEQLQPTRTTGDTALIWIDLVAEIIVAAVLQEEHDARSSQVAGS